MENKVIAKEYVRNIILKKIDWLDKQMEIEKYRIEMEIKYKKMEE